MTQRPLADPQVRSHRRAPLGCGVVRPRHSRLSAHLTGMVLALVWAVGLGLPSPARADAVLSQQKNCNACHAMDGPITGPSFKAMAQKYANDRAAADKLTTRILKGGVGVWGPVPMPANPQLNDAEARRLAVWILGLK